MPTKSSQCFNFTFRPTMSEFNRYEEEFLDKLLKKFNTSKYIISREKGKSDIVNHIQGFMEFKKNKRADNLRKTFNSLISDMDITYPKVALKVSPCIRDINICQGHILKEQETLNGVIHNGYSMEYLLKVKKEYDNMKLVKKLEIDKLRITERNVYQCFMNYYSSNKDRIGQLDYANVYRELHRMVKDGYYCFNLLMNKNKLKRMCNLILIIHEMD